MKYRGPMRRNDAQRRARDAQRKFFRRKALEADREKRMNTPAAEVEEKQDSGEQ